MKKTIAILLVLTIVAALTLAVGCQKSKGASYKPFEEDATDYHFEDIYPALVGYDMPADTGDVDVLKELAYRLYAKANELAQLCPRRAAISICNVETTGLPVTGQITDVKNGDEYYKLDYQEAAMIGIITASPAHAKATYANIALPEAYYMQIGEIQEVDSKFTADWNQEAYVEWQTIPYFHPTQELLFQQTDMWILPETIKNVAIVHLDEEGYWRMVLELDVKNAKTTEITQAKLRASSDQTKKAKYTSIVETIEIWDNGMFKSFMSMDEWKAGIISSKIDYRTYISYDEDACDITKMDNYLGIREAAFAAEQQRQQQGDGQE